MRALLIVLLMVAGAASADEQERGARIFVNPNGVAVLITGMMGKSEAILPGGISKRKATVWVVAKNGKYKTRPVFEKPSGDEKLKKADKRAVVGDFCGDAIVRPTKRKSQKYIEYEVGSVTLCRTERVSVSTAWLRDVQSGKKRLFCYWEFPDRLMDDWITDLSSVSGIELIAEGRDISPKYSHCLSAPTAPIAIRGGGVG